MVKRCSQITVTSLLLVGVLLAGCAKRPALTAASAPAPTGSSGTSAAPAPTSSGGPAVTATPGTSGPQAPATSTAPAAPTARPAVKDFTAASDVVDIYFDFDKYDIRPENAKILDSNARWLKSNDQLILIEGHCDERGTNEYNVALGERRAKSAMNYLVAQGITANRITIVSYGEERPVCTAHGEACWSKNRRAHFLVKPK
jgi:peptidoglycan-associated lipoprotein